MKQYSITYSQQSISITITSKELVMNTRQFNTQITGI